MRLFFKASIMAIFFLACKEGNNKANTQNIYKQVDFGKMKPAGDKDIDGLIANLKKSMEDYMKKSNPSYSQKDVNECADLLSEYALNVFKTHSKEEAMLIVKSTVLKLNALNEKCDFALIETEEREQIVEIIILASHKMNYTSLDEDITEEWREW